MTPWLDDGDVRVHVGDVRDVLTTLPDESVDCVITSPPYWGLRDYGTGSWDGGNPDCDHTGPAKASDKSGLKNDGRPADLVGQNDYERAATVPFRDVCGKCGARRVDQQLGLEPTPDAYVQNMVGVFREIRRVLALHGTCWLNLGDSYTSVGTEAGGQGANGQMATRRVAQVRDRKAVHGDVLRPYAVGGLPPKNLVGIPWRVAFALQADGWWLRSEIIWAKPNPMPESVTDRPTKSHEQVFLLAKRPVYWFDQEAVREPHSREWWDENVGEGRLADEHRPRPKGGWGDGGKRHGNGTLAGRNIRSVWEIATQPFPDAHFATYPEELVRRCLLAGCPAEVCRVCGKPRERIVEREQPPEPEHRQPTKRLEPGQAGNVGAGGIGFRASRLSGQEMNRWRAENPGTERWSDCGHNAYRPGVVLDPFLGSGTTALVARNHGRHAVGIELNEEYARIAARRLQQLSLLA